MPPSPVVALLKDLYALRQRGGVTDAEARWVLEIVLPVYGVTLTGLVTRVVEATQAGVEASAQARVPRPGGGPR